MKIQKMFSETTLYYFYSTIAQVIAAAVAIIAVLAQFRISALHKILIGDGKAIYDTKIDPQFPSVKQAYLILDDIHTKRLRDGISREDINEIRKILKLLAENEAKQGYDINDREHGFQWTFNKFTKTEEQLNDLNKYSKWSFYSAFTLAFYSVFAILTSDLLKCSQVFHWGVFGIDVILIFACLYLLLKGIHYSMLSLSSRIIEE
jgi:hypothetical protein